MILPLPEAAEGNAWASDRGQGGPDRDASRRVMLLCGSLEPGKDGVGDYTRLLMAQCRELGIDCFAVALNDGYVTQPVNDPETGLRLPATMSWAERVARTAELRDQIQPDWISLQFVPYAFNSKGIVWNLASSLRKIVGDARLHVMFHELWIGGARSASWKERAVGKLQQIGITRVIRALRPDLVATSNGTYIGMLKHRGFSATKLPLFGNIPVIARNESAPSVVMRAPTITFDLRRRDSYWLVLLFGTLHPQWKQEPLFSKIHRAAKAAGRHVCLAAVGRLGPEGGKKWALIAQQYASSFSFMTLGEQEPEFVSQLFQEADFGIAASPWRLIGKSGSAIAMIEHGLPVIASRDDWHPRYHETLDEVADPLFHRCDRFLEEKLIVGLPKRTPRSGVREVATQFVQSLGMKSA